MGIYHVAVRVTDNPPKNASAGVRGQAKDKVSDEVFRLLNVVVGGELIDSNEQIINESGDLKEVVSCLPRNYHVLDFELTNLIGVRQRHAVCVAVVSKLPYLFNGNPNFCRGKMG